MPLPAFTDSGDRRRPPSDVGAERPEGCDARFRIEIVCRPVRRGHDREGNGINSQKKNWIDAFERSGWTVAKRRRTPGKPRGDQNYRSTKQCEPSIGVTGPVCVEGVAVVGEGREEVAPKLWEKSATCHFLAPTTN